MIPPKVTEKLMDYIDLAYPGGIGKFTAAGGDLTYLPEHLLVSFPKKNEKLKQGITNHFKDISIFFFSDPFGMEAKTYNEIRNDLIEILMKDEIGLFAQSVTISQRSCYVFIQSTANLPKALVKDIRDMTDKYEVPRVVFCQPNHVPEIWEVLDTEDTVDQTSEEPLQASKKTVSTRPSNHPDRRGITSEDISDLKIDLNKEQDVLDFLKSLEG